MKRSSTMNYVTVAPGLNLEIKPSTRRKAKSFFRTIKNFLFHSTIF